MKRPPAQARKTNKTSTRTKKSSSTPSSRHHDNQTPPTKRAKCNEDDDVTYLPDNTELSDNQDFHETRRVRKRGGRGKPVKASKDTKSPYFSDSNEEKGGSKGTSSRRGRGGKVLTRSPYFTGQVHKQDQSLDDDFTYFHKKKKLSQQDDTTEDVLFTDSATPSSQGSKFSNLSSGCGNKKRCGSLSSSSSSSNDEVISISSGDVPSPAEHLYGMYNCTLCVCMCVYVYMYN